MVATATPTKGSERFLKLSKDWDKEKFNKLNKEYTFSEYLDMVSANPKIAYSAFQRAYGMIMKAGVEKINKHKRKLTVYKFFNDPELPIYGLEESLQTFVSHFKSAANWYGPEKRILLLHGPVGSSKSTICRLLKRGYEKYSESDEGAIYTYRWKNLGEVKDKDGKVIHEALDVKSEVDCPMNDDPLRLIPKELRSGIQKELNDTLAASYKDKDKDTLHTIRLNGDLNPACDLYMQKLLERYNGDWQQVMENHITVYRLIISEAKRCGIGTFQPKDPKNQDATELTGDVNYTKLAHFGVDSDPRAFGFDGEFEVANRGIIEFIEVLKLEKEFLYDLLGACQERQFKPKKFPQVDVDMIIIGHTNNPEYEKLKSDITMEALRDRTVKIDIPYLLELNKEIKVLEQDYNVEKIPNVHIVPHTIEIAALFGVLTRLQSAEKDGCKLIDKAKLYNGKVLPKWTEEKVREMKDKYPEEGMKRGVSARYIQNKISNTLVASPGYINFFQVLNELEKGLDQSSLISSPEEKEFYKSCVTIAKKELDDILKKEVQMALINNRDAAQELFDKYIDNICAHIKGAKVQNPWTMRDEAPDERLMRSIEEKAGVSEPMADDYRRRMVAFMGTEGRGGNTVKWDTNPELSRAIEAKLFEDMKDSIRISSMAKGAAVGDKATQEKIAGVKERLIQQFGYNERSASDVLDYVSTIFSRGDTEE